MSLPDQHDAPETPAGQQEKDHSPLPPPPTTPALPPQPNGGYGWVVTACTATINAHTWGINSSYGVFLNHYLTTNVFPGASNLEFAFIGGLSIGMALLVSPLATITTRLFGTRTTLLIGTLLEFTALLAASWASRIWHLFLSQGVCFGLGMGFLFVGSVGVVPQWFTTRRSLANGISAAGSGIGGLVYSLATAAMIRNIGLAWTFRVLAILALVVNGTCAMFVRDRNKAIGSTQLAFNVELFKRVEYLLLVAFGFFSMLGYIVLLFSLANYCHSVGLTTQQASTVSAILNLGQGLGRPPIGYFSDSLGRLNMAFLMTLLCGVLSLALWVPSTSYGLLIFFALAGGAVAGTFWAVVGPVTTEVVGLRDVPSALNMIWIVLALPTTFSEPIALEIVSFDGGRYLGAQIFTGVMYIAAAVSVLLLRGWKSGEMDAFAGMKKNDSLDDLRIDDAGAEVRVECRKSGRKRILFDMFKIRKV